MHIQPRRQQTASAVASHRFALNPLKGNQTQVKRYSVNVLLLLSAVLTQHPCCDRTAGPPNGISCWRSRHGRLRSWPPNSGSSLDFALSTSRRAPAISKSTTGIFADGSDFIPRCDCKYQRSQRSQKLGDIIQTERQTK